jgi:hypothetical protein
VDLDPRSQGALRGALEQLLRPLCRLLLRHSVSFNAFADMAKRVYVDVALKDFSLPGKKPTTSRVAVLSGLTRKEVHRILADPVLDGAEGFERYNRATRVLTGWARDAEFLDRAAGRVRSRSTARRALRCWSSATAATCRRARCSTSWCGSARSSGWTMRACNWSRTATCRNTARSTSSAYSGRDVADLIDTIDHNLQHGADDPRFQRKVMYAAIPAEALPAFRKLSAAQGQALLEKLDRWLAEHDVAPIAKGGEAPERARVGLGIYYFEERLEPTVDEGATPP